jgi:hypothetical protein
MTSARAIEYRITRELARGGELELPAGAGSHYVRQLIAVTAAATGLLVFGSYMPELVAAAVAGSAVWGLGAR